MTRTGVTGIVPVMPLEVATEILLRWGAATKARRDELGLTQVDLAERSGIDQRAISEIERGKYQPSLDRRLKIAKALDTTHDSLFSVDEVVA